MRSRLQREGSAGLLILAGLVLFTGLILWIRGFNFGKRTFQFTAVFANTVGLQEGATVRYRGVNVGKVTAVKPGTNGVDVSIEIGSPDLQIPKDVIIETNQSGLIGETYLNILPTKSIPLDQATATPLDQDCNSVLIICHKDRVQGQIGVSFDDVLRNTNTLAQTYTDPRFVQNLNAATRNTAVAAGEFTRLSRNLSQLAVTANQQISGFSSVTNNLNRATNQTAARFGNTADQYSATAQELSQLVRNLNGLVVTNRGGLVATLNNFSVASQDLRTTIAGINPTLNRFASPALMRNLEILSANAAQASANAAQASANFRDVSNNLNNPESILALQRTLDSARVTFENAQKITSDLDELTGDPAFRERIRQLVNGLSGLVSSTEDLQNQVKVANSLGNLQSEMPKLEKPISTNSPATDSPNNSQKNPELVFSTSQSSFSPMPEIAQMPWEKQTKAGSKFVGNSTLENQAKPIKNP